MNRLKIAVTGVQGQLVQSLIRRAALANDITIIPLARPLLDLEKPSTVAAAILAARPDLVVNAAAYTAVDKAEDETDLAFRINEKGARTIAAASASIRVPVIQISTDYVFSGAGSTPHLENEPTEPLSVYGASKLAGEIAVAAENPQHVILRTSWVYSPFGQNFVKTMIRLADERERVSVVADQYGNPTSALDLADGILHIARIAKAAPVNPNFGVFHIAGAGEASWADVAETIMKARMKRGLKSAVVQRIRSDEFPAKAKRPLNSRLSCDKLKQIYGWSAPSWQDSLEATLAELLDTCRGHKQ